MKSTIPSFILIGAVGVVIGILIQPPAGDEHQPAQATNANTQDPVAQRTNTTEQDITQETNRKLDSLQLKIDDLSELLVQESEKRIQLETTVAQLKKSLTQAAPTHTADSNRREDSTLRTAARNDTSNSGQWFNEQALIEAGVDAGQANRIRQVYEDVEMQKLYLRDQAIREGWIGDERYRQERAKLDDQLDGIKDELGEKAYDAYLYASGQPNRVIVTSALINSPANKAGILSGDTILRYDNKRIYSWSDLRNATSTGDINTIVLVEITRNGQPVSVFVPRGPLGVQLDNTSVKPIN